MRYYEGFFLVFLNHFIPIHGIVGGYEAQKHRNWVVSAASCLMGIGRIQVRLGEHHIAASEGTEQL